MNKPSRQYERIKTFIRNGIDGGDWVSGEMIPSENQLARKFSLSRMTVNRAVKELDADGVLDRVQGKGTFVSGPRPLRSVLQIQGINEEILERGNEHSCKVIRLRAVMVSQELSATLNIPVGKTVWHSSILHFENELPIQLEQRWVNPKICKHYLEQDFTLQIPHDYLMSQAPFTKGEHTIEACQVKASIAKQLELKSKEACLLIHRRTWVGKHIATYAKLYHPGNRFQLTTELTR